MTEKELQANLQPLSAASDASLRKPEKLAEVICQMGLCDHTKSGHYPHELWDYCRAEGLQIWHHPVQFARYLIKVAQLKPRFYVEVGTFRGGTFIATREYLRRVNGEAPIALAVEPHDVHPQLAFYLGTELGAGARLLHMPPTDRRVEDALEAQVPTVGNGLAMLDNDHSYLGVQREAKLLGRHCRWLAVHDIANVWTPEANTYWCDAVRSSKVRWHEEYGEQYMEYMANPVFGIGLLELSAPL
jgi:hypothetical protein